MNIITRCSAALIKLYPLILDWTNSVAIHTTHKHCKHTCHYKAMGCGDFAAGVEAAITSGCGLTQSELEFPVHPLPEVIHSGGLPRGGPHLLGSLRTIHLSRRRRPKGAARFRQNYRYFLPAGSANPNFAGWKVLPLLYPLLCAELAK